MHGKTISLSFLALLVMHVWPAAANYNYYDYYDSNAAPASGTDSETGTASDPNSTTSASTETAEAVRDRWTSWRRSLLRRQLDVLSWRFSPQWRAQTTLPPDLARAFIAPVAGEGPAPEGWSLWKSTAFMHMRQTIAGARARGDSLSGSVGLDKALTDRLTAGLSFTLTRSKAKDRTAGTWERTWQKALAFYADMRLTDELALNAQVGPVWQRQTFRDGSAIGLVQGRRHSLGWMASGSLSAQRWLSQSVLISGQLSLLASRDRWRAHTASGAGGTITRPARTEALVQGVAEAGVSLWLAPVMPYLRLAYGYDLYRRNITAGSDRDDFTLTGGLSWFGSGALEGLSFDLSGNARLGRRNEREYSVTFGTRWSW